MYNDLIPEDLQQRLIVLRDATTLVSWEIGDIALEAIRLNKAVAVMKIYAAVGMFVGKQARTIREYAAVSAMYSPEEREEFAVLAYDHFRVAMRFGSRWREALTWAVDHTEFGRPATVDAMLANFATSPSDENFALEEAEEDSRWTRIEQAIARLRQEIAWALPEDVLETVNRLIEKIEKAIENAKEVMV